MAWEELFSDMVEDYFYGRAWNEPSCFGLINSCRYCGAENVEWVKSDNGAWRLYDSNGLHHCEEFKAAMREKNEDDAICVLEEI